MVADRDHETSFRAFIEDAPHAIAVLDRRMCYVVASRRWHQDYGLDDAVLRGRSHYEVFPEIGERWKHVHQRALAGEVVRADIDRFVRSDGSVQWQRWLVYPWRNVDGQICGIVISTEDVTDLVDGTESPARDAQLQALRQSEERCAEVFDRAPFALALVRLPDGVLVSVNEAMCRMLERSRQEAIGKTSTELGIGDPTTRARVAQLFAESAAHDIPLDHTTPSGQQLLLSASFDPVTLDGEPHALATFRDVTALERAHRALEAEVAERQRAERELEHSRRNEERLRHRFERLDRASLALSQALARMGEAPVDELLQAVVDQARIIADAELAALGVGDDPDAAFAPWVVSGLDETQVAGLGRVPRPRGVLGEVVRSGRPLRVPAVAEHPAFAGLPPRHFPIGAFLGVPVRHLGRTVGHLYLANKRTAEAFSEDDQQLVEMFAERASVTLEIARLAQEVRAAVDAREQLLAMVSHDLRSPLTTIELSARALALARSGDDVCRRTTDVVLRSTARMTRLIDDLLAAATIEAGSFKVSLAPEDLRSIVEESLQALEPIADASSVRLHHEVPASLPRVRGDRRRLIQVLVNLVGNAIKFLDAGGNVWIRAAAEPDQVRVTVRDDGPGIHEDLVDHVFDRYRQGGSRTHTGVGLGLYIAHGIVQAHGGQLEVESQPGEGCSFTFTLPTMSPATHGRA
ncbi:PAS domain-containing sensor histidine kinase [Paraliomyxa miuraensis]|uniref:PAS domain-containing sensor histidine kinase n=1 Tax=Paraliomyxa miuraensis TaxID=376150 RepID=UPI00224E292E|nr:ATP-binding protein [Paraliomyxa miuraensis]MCX4239817.1 ATP-binding protein [Paraliomyxa miuraensis]